MELYAGLLLVAIGIGYLMVRFVQARSSITDVKVGSTVASQVRKQSHSSKQKASSRNATTKTLRRSALVADANHKPWGW